MQRILAYEDSDPVNSEDMNIIRKVMSRVRNPMGGYPSRFGGYESPDYQPAVYQDYDLGPGVPEDHRYGQYLITPQVGFRFDSKMSMTWYMGYVAGMGIWIPEFTEVNKQLTAEHWSGQHGKTKQDKWLYQIVNIHLSTSDFPTIPLDTWFDIVFSLPWMGRPLRQFFELWYQASGWSMSIWELMSFEGTIPPQLVKYNWNKCKRDMQYYYDNYLAIEELTLGDMDMYGNWNIEEDLVSEDPELPGNWWEKLQ